MTVPVAPPQPDELVYSALARARRRARFSSLQLSEQLFQERFVIPPLFGLRLEMVARCLRERSGWTKTAKQILEAHTLTRLAMSFMTEESQSQCLVTVCSEEPKGATLRQLYRSLDTSHSFRLRFCPECRRDDLERRTGEACWYRSHQIQGLRICYHHKKVRLRETDVIVGHQKHYVALDEVGDGVSLPVPDSATNLQESIANDVWNALNLPVARFNRQKLATKYVTALHSDGVRRGRPASILKDLERFFGRRALTFTSRHFNKWTTHFVSLQERATIPVVAYATFAGRLKLSLSDFIISSKRVPQPERPPWPCMNPDCAKFQKPVIRTRSLTRSGHATFMCPSCYSRYSRPLPLRMNRDGSFEYAIHTRSLDWYRRFDTVWSDPNLTWRDLERRLNMSRGKVRHLAALRGLPDVPQARRTLKAARKRAGRSRLEREHSLRFERRTEWQRLLLIEKPSASEAGRMSKLRRRLLVEDREWAEKNGIVPTPDNFATRAAQKRN